MSDQNPANGPRSSIPVTAQGTEPQGPPTVAPKPVAPEPEAESSGDGEAEVQVTVFAALGGQQFFDQLVERFYTRVERDQVLLSLYPEPDDLGPARERLSLFLAQYWGGPQTYSERRGHPRLRMRHAPYAIGEREKDHWLAAMAEALEESMPGTPLDEELRDEVHRRMTEYFEMAATHLVNQPPG